MDRSSVGMHGQRVNACRHQQCPGFGCMFAYCQSHTQVDSRDTSSQQECLHKGFTEAAGCSFSSFLRSSAKPWPTIRVLKPHPCGIKGSISKGRVHPLTPLTAATSTTQTVATNLGFKDWRLGAKTEVSMQSVHLAMSRSAPVDLCPGPG